MKEVRGGFLERISLSSVWLETPACPLGQGMACMEARHPTLVSVALAGRALRWETNKKSP